LASVHAQLQQLARGLEQATRRLRDRARKLRRRNRLSLLAGGVRVAPWIAVKLL
jgi:hypothetical protein